MPSNRNRAVAFLSFLTCITLALLGYLWFRSRQASVVVEWSTASELDTVGFNVYRSEVPDNAGQRVNEQLIPAVADSLTGGEYQFVDTTVVPGRTYYYWLEDVDASGNVNRNGPIEAQAASGAVIEWLLMAALLAVLGWGWAGVLRRPAGPAAGQKPADL
ncbi:MAG: hypothetical protein ACOYYS_21825 [Chloroflexota bacterium]